VSPGAEAPLAASIPERGAEGRYRVDHDARTEALTVRRSIFGVPISRAVVSSRAVVDVEMDWRRWHENPARPTGVGVTEGRLTLVTASGERRPLTEGFHRGHAQHRKAADELRTLLACPPRAPEIAERLGREARRFEPLPGLLAILFTARRPPEE
jgi:hypothetical protein